MENIYKKIYEAISDGIHKALVLPDEQADDISIRWHKKSISNTLNIMNEYVREFMNELLDSDEQKKLYKQIVCYYKETHNMYKIDSFKQLSDIYLKISSIKGIGYKSIDLSWINMSGICHIITKDDMEIPFNQCNGQDFKNAKFIKLRIPEMNNAELILHSQLFLEKQLYWYYNFNDFDNKPVMAKSGNNLFNGYELTQEIKKQFNNITLEQRDAFNYINNLDISLYEAYMPSIAELKFIYGYENLINYIFKKISEYSLNQAPVLDYTKQTCILSSTLSRVDSPDNVAALSMAESLTRAEGRQRHTCTVYVHKRALCRVLPLFKKDG